MQRRAVLAGSTAALAGLAGCSGLLGSPDQSAGSTPTSSGGPVPWRTSTDGDASATVNSPQSVDLRVYKCNAATARKPLGERSGELRIAFDYTVEAEQWYEDAQVVIVEDGTERQLADVTDASVKQTRSGSVSDSVDVTVPVDGNVTVAFRLAPTQHCSNADHANTFYRVRNVTLEMSGNG